MRRSLLLVVVALTACSSAGGEATTTVAEITTTSVAIATTATTSTVPTSRQLYDRLSASIAYITTDLGSGSGVLLDGGWVVTNAHVVWPYDRVRVVFPDGTEITDAPVHRSDVYRDVAVVGPVAVDAPPLLLAAGAEYGVGDTVYLIGYPGEVEDFPSPAITQGVVSRIREWPQADLTFIQTDALIAGGQSGGALVSAAGEVLGVSGLGGFADGNFALVAAAEDLIGVVDELVAGTTPVRFEPTPFVSEGGATEYTVDLASYWHDGIFVLRESVGTTVTVEVSDTDHGVFVTDALGYGVTADVEPVQSVEFVVEYDEPHFVFVSSLGPGPTSTTIVSSHPIVRWVDPDDDIVLERGDSVQAVIDISGDYDVFRITLGEGETVDVAVDGLIDPTLTIGRVDSDESLDFDLDSGGGLFGTDARLSYTAPAAGEYLVVVEDDLLEPGGGYVLTVD